MRENRSEYEARLRLAQTKFKPYVLKKPKKTFWRFIFFWM